MSAPQWPDNVREALQRSEIMALSSLDEDGGSWTCPVQYSVDDELAFVFLSRPEARHVANIARDPRVSLAVYSEPGPPGGNLGLQVRGTAQRVGGDSTGWQQFRVRPDEVWCFDSRIDRGRHQIETTRLGERS